MTAEEYIASGDYRRAAANAEAIATAAAAVGEKIDLGKIARALEAPEGTILFVLTKWIADFSLRRGEGFSIEVSDE